MKIKVGSSLEWTLARACAEVVYDRVVRQHLFLIGLLPEFRHEKDAGFIEVQQAVKSLRGFERRNFAATMGWIFKQRRAEKGLEIRGRDYVAKVREREAIERQTREPVEPGR